MEQLRVGSLFGGCPCCRNGTTFRSIASSGNGHNFDEDSSKDRIGVRFYDHNSRSCCATKGRVKRPGRSDSITVTADIPKEQIRNEDECDARILSGQEALKNADAVKAEAYFQQALSLIEKHHYLANHRPTVLRNLGTSFVAQNRILEAVNTLKHC